VLNRIMVIRATVKPHEKSPEEASEARQGSRRDLSNSIGGLDNGQTGIGVSFTNMPPANAVRGADADTHDADGCGGNVEHITRDSELPPATGGIA
jgi:hypothetical protein